MTDFLRIDPVRLFEIRGQVSQLYTATKELAVGNNNVVVAAESGKRIRVMGFTAQDTAGAMGYLYLKTASGGTIIWTRTSYPPNTTGIPLQIPVINSGYCETNTGEGLYVDVYASALALNLQYIIYTPS